MVHQFYKESSKLGRPDDRGDVTSVTTIDVSTRNLSIKEGKTILMQIGTKEKNCFHFEKNEIFNLLN